MRALLLAASVALAAIPASPALAGEGHGSRNPFGDFRAAPSGFGVTIHRGGGRHGRGGAVAVNSGGFYYGGEWALYNNRTWESDSYNDWWHDNPERAFPRWVTSGQCARQWFAGDTLRC